jgi:hypothetical protein
MNQVEKEKCKKEILNKYSHLRQTSKDESSLITACKNIRQELKIVFPGIKFSVRSERFSGGDSITISYNDGALTKEVESITDKYQEGNFDSMEDIYNYSNNPFNDFFGGAKYVHANRHLSKESYIKVAKKLGYEIEVDEHSDIKNTDYKTKQLIYQTARNTSFYNAA